MAIQGHLSIPGYHSPGASSIDSSANQTPNYPSTPLNEPDKEHQERPELAPTSFPGVSTGDFSTKSSSEKPPGGFAATGISSVSVDDYHKLHIMLPAAGSTSTVPVSITSLDRCIVAMSIPTANGKPYASLTAKGINESLLICGQVNGPAHITGIERSVIVVSCRQFRMHNCSDVDVYLSCSSNPIIEDCSNIRFGRIPKAYVSFLLVIFPSRRLFTYILLSRPWTMTVPTTKTVGARSKISNGLSRSLVQTGVYLTPTMPFLKRSGQRLFPAGRDGLLRTSCMP